MTKELESYLRGVIEEIHKRFGHASWIHLNRGQHPELKGYPVDTIVAMIHSTLILLSEDVSLDRVRYQVGGEVKNEPLDSYEWVVEGLDRISRGKMDDAPGKSQPPSYPLSMAGRP